MTNELKNNEIGINKFLYKGMLIGEGLLYEESSQTCQKYLFEPTEELIKNRIPFFQQVNNSLINNFNRAKWLQEARLLVYKSNLAKFKQNKRLKSILLETGNKTIVEDNHRDLIWGSGITEGYPDYNKRTKWQGTNWLGEALIQVREELKSEP